MTGLEQRASNVMPDWARPTHPVLRYLLVREDRRQPTVRRWLVRMLGAATLFWMVAGSYEAFRSDMSFGVSEQGEWALFSILYPPLLVIQFFTLTSGLVLTAGLLGREQEQGTWEALKITSHGAQLALWARWVAVFYQLRWLLLFITLPRVIFAGQMLVDLTAYQGRHLDLYTSGITPEPSLFASMALLATTMTALLLLPLVLLGLNAALGLFISTWFRRRFGVILAQAVILLAEVFAYLFALAAGWTVLSNSNSVDWPLYSIMSTGEKWGALLAVGTIGDQGLRLMNLRTTLQMWVDVEYGILVGAALLGITLALAALTRFLLWWAVRRASCPQRR